MNRPGFWCAVWLGWLQGIVTGLTLVAGFGWGWTVDLVGLAWLTFGVVPAGLHLAEGMARRG